MRTISTLVLVLLVSTAFAANFLFAEPKLDRALRQALATEAVKSFTVLVQFTPLDVDNYLTVDDVEQRTQFLVNDLQVHAQLTQASIVARLTREKIAHKTIWVQNAISIKACPREVIEWLAVHPLVQQVVYDEERVFDFEKPASIASSNDEVEWNVEWIQGTKVWNELKHKGEGITVGIIDTGAAFKHEAIESNYRGKNEDGSYSHDYNWFQTIGTNSSTPIDDHSHGTHCAGTILGSTRTHAYGVAPAAKFISCKAFTGGGSGSKQSILDCLQFMLAPHDLHGDNPEPSKRPEVISNSYVCPSCGLKPTIDALTAAGIMVVAAAGNYGPSCSSVSAEPGVLDNVLSIGALDVKKDNVTSFSSRGPVRVDGSNRIKPDVTAPGANILSSIPPNSYGRMSGTSMACPHVAGSVSLLWSAVPELKRKPHETKELIQKFARHIDVVGTYCNSKGIPNNMYGWGTTQIYDAIQGAKKMFK